MKGIICCLTAMLLFSVSCNRDKGYHLPKERMQALLTDIQLAEGYASMAGYDTVQNAPAKNNDSLAVFYSEVLHHHQITLTQFRQSLDWYRMHPDLLDTVYVRAMNKLNKSGRTGR